RAGDGANFPADVWNELVPLLAHMLTKGAPKTSKICQNKYGQLRGVYKVVKALRENSGWHWDDQKGACINEATKSSWDEYQKAHPKAKPFRNRGWPYWAGMNNIMPQTATGAHVY
ncbi:hypothetical protein C8R44DRAFT_563469, partial [Mycena epipterygia]